LYFTASGISTPVGGHPMHRLREDCTEMHGQQNIKISTYVLYVRLVN